MKLTQLLCIGLLGIMILYGFVENSPAKAYSSRMGRMIVADTGDTHDPTPGGTTYDTTSPRPSEVPPKDIYDTTSPEKNKEVVPDRRKTKTKKKEAVPEGTRDEKDADKP